MRSRHVCFVAMSGVRIVNPALRALGMTLPGFIERGNVIASLPCLGLLTLAGLTPDDWEMSYVEVDQLDDASLAEVVAQSRDLIAISSLSARINDAYNLADRLRAHGRTVVIGGLHASVLPGEAQDHAEAVVVGEGEPIWADLLADYLRGGLQARYERPRSRSFVPWAVPRYDLLDLEKYNRVPLQTTRGCPLDCSFCGASRLISHYKRKPYSHIEAELLAITSQWKKPFIELADDNTFVDKNWAREVVPLIGRFGVRWFTESDISLADDSALLRLLAQNGCTQVLIGLESVDDESLAETDTKHWKQKRRNRYRDAIARIQDAGISVNGCFIIGFDHDGPGVFEATSDFVRTSGLAEVQVTILTPFPGTSLQSRLHHEGRLLKQSYWDECTLFDLVFRPALMTVDQLEDGFRDLVAELYSPSSTDHRRAILHGCTRRAVANGLR